MAHSAVTMTLPIMSLLVWLQMASALLYCSDAINMEPSECASVDYVAALQQLQLTVCIWCWTGAHG